MAAKYRSSSIFTLLVMVLSWASLIFYPKESVRKYLPVTILSGYLVLMTDALAIAFKWWTNKGGFKIRTLHEFCFLLGPYVAGTLWIFHLTFGKLGRYLFTNLIMDSLLAFSLKKLFPYFKVFKFVHFKPIYIFFLSFGSSIILYVFQVFIGRPTRMRSFF
ncbi:hypothetical protein HPT25_22430 [Bacillus sp. BRMEA1]|uniref:hypothetical protein n=1 Tax=Neobacillus endophyticus TaxID=2738405 RepID=UPI001565E305|nr:hypothetical protein [Neobacillus endophyticus]NRD80099.1 hypothetical protein [Neobacillus endophyticus]